MDEPPDDRKEEKLFERVLLQAYGVAFPPLQVAVRASERGPWTLEEATATVTRLASAPVIDHCLHRGHAGNKKTCVPHLILDCMSLRGLATGLPAEIGAVILRGGKLTAKQKTRLSMVRNVQDRVQWTLAYASNRCFATGFSHAVVLMCFQADGVGHANMVLLERSPDALAITCYEPNGIAAAERYATAARYFAHVSDSLPDLVGCPVTFQTVGLALQTFLGRRWVRASRASVSVLQRGYPICQAAVLWLFSKFLTAHRPGVDLARYEARVMAQGRSALKHELLAWIVDLEAWVVKSYAPKMRAMLHQIFAGSNLVDIQVQYGAIPVLWP